MIDVPPIPIVQRQNPGVPPPGFSFGGRPLRSVLGDREARTDGQCGELIDRGAAGAPVGQLLFVEVRGHMRLPFAGRRPDHRARVEPLQSIRIVQRKRLPTSNVDSMTVLRARRGGTGSKYVTLRGGRRRIIRSSSFGQGWRASTSILCRMKRFYPHAYARRTPSRGTHGIAVLERQRAKFSGARRLSK
jgi:hypothetical protein